MTASCLVRIFCIVLFFVLCCFGPWGFVAAIFWWLVLSGIWNMTDRRDE